VRTLNFLLSATLAVTDEFQSGYKRNEDSEAGSSREKPKRRKCGICTILMLMEKRGPSVYFVRKF